MNTEFLNSSDYRDFDPYGMWKQCDQMPSSYGDELLTKTTHNQQQDGTLSLLSIRNVYPRSNALPFIPSISPSDLTLSSQGSGPVPVETKIVPVVNNTPSKFTKANQLSVDNSSNQTDVCASTMNYTPLYWKVGYNYISIAEVVIRSSSFKYNCIKKGCVQKWLNIEQMCKHWFSHIPMENAFICLEQKCFECFADREDLIKHKIIEHHIISNSTPYFTSREIYTYQNTFIKIFSMDYLSI